MNRKWHERQIINMDTIVINFFTIEKSCEVFVTSIMITPLCFDMSDCIKKNSLYASFKNVLLSTGSTQNWYISLSFYMFIVCFSWNSFPISNLFVSIGNMLIIDKGDPSPSQHQSLKKWIFFLSGPSFLFIWHTKALLAINKIANSTSILH